MFGAGSVLDIGETEVEELFRRTSEKPMETFSQGEWRERLAIIGSNLAHIYGPSLLSAVSSFPKDKPERLTEEDLEKEVRWKACTIA